MEEERFNRRKLSDGLPHNAIQFCLRKGGISFSDIDHIGYYLDPAVLKKTFVDDVVRRFGCSPDPLHYYVDASNKISQVEQTLRETHGASPNIQFHYINHHVAHAASAFYISGFDQSAILTLDGSGDRETCAVYYAGGPEISKVQDILVYPESLGFIYTVIAGHLGLGWIEGPGKLMGLAGYGTPDPSFFEDIVILRDDPSRPIEIDLSYFDYHTGGTGLSEKGKERFGRPRERDEGLVRRHCQLAASAQQMLEQSIIHIARFVPRLVPQTSNLCFAGGVALNVRANRLILDSQLFDRLFVPPAAYDGGTSLGCALYLNAQYTSCYRYDFDVYCGPDIEQDYSIDAALSKFKDRVKWEVLKEADLYDEAAKYIKENRIIGWVQGRMEWGPRALGNRSILTNAMNPHAKDQLNARVKKREGFRPYAPSVLLEECYNWFDLSIASPYMLVEAGVIPENRSIVPGVVHVDGTSRIQTVSKMDNQKYYKLIKRFYELTGVPLVLNTSFNRHGEPMVNTPEEAIIDLIETGMDALFMGNYRITKRKRFSPDGIKSELGSSVRDFASEMERSPSW